MTVRLAALRRPPAWTDLALCAQSDPEAWFPETGDGRSARQAVRICRQCPVIAECLEHALERRERYGVWGGTTPNERRALLRARRQAAA